MKNHSVYFPLLLLLLIFLSTQESQVRLVHFLWDRILDTYKTIQGNRVHKLFTLSVPQLDLHLLTLMTTGKHPLQMCTKKAFRKLRSYRLDSSRKSEKEIQFSPDQLKIKRRNSTKFFSFYERLNFLKLFPLEKPPLIILRSHKNVHESTSWLRCVTETMHWIYILHFGVGRCHM